MSGGHFDYKQHAITDIADEVERLIRYNDSTEKDSFGQDFGHHYPHAVIVRFKAALATLRRAAIMAHRIDWLVSGDDGEGAFHKRWIEELRP